MTKEQLYRRLRREYPGNSFALIIEDYYYNHTTKKAVEKKVFVHDCCANPNGGLASGFGKSWKEAYENMLLDKLKYGEAQEAGNATG
jgi:hypothetical protein